MEVLFVNDTKFLLILDHHTTYRMAAANSEEYEKWVTSLQLITNRFGMAAVTSISSRRSERGASVPCLSAMSTSTSVGGISTEMNGINKSALPSVASQPNAMTSVDKTNDEV